MGDKIEYRCTLEESAARGVRARLVLPDGTEMDLTEQAPGVMTTPVPAVGGVLRLVVDQVADLPDGAPALPWEVVLTLSAEAVADWHAGSTCGARLLLPGDDFLGITKILLRPDRTILFPGRPCTGGPDGYRQSLMHHDAELLAAGSPVERYGYPYNPTDPEEAWEGDWPLDLLPGVPGGPPQLVYVEVMRFAPVPDGAPLSLRVERLPYELQGTWQVTAAIPSERPSGAAVGQVFTVAGVECCLEEVLLGLTGTHLVVFGANVMNEAVLCDSEGRTFAVQGLSVWGSPSRGAHSVGGARRGYIFEPVPAGVTSLTLSGEGMRVSLKGPWDLPLVPGASVQVRPESVR